MKPILSVIVCLLLLLLAVRGSGAFLVIDEPRKSDVILVLAGETDHRPTRALELYRQGYASKIILDVPAASRIYVWTQKELAQKYIEGLAESRALRVCPIAALSTRDEAREAESCLQAVGARDVLLVTSDFHTRRGLSTFRREIPGRRFAVAAAYDATQFDTRWWRHREWAKVSLDEWLRLIWWQGVDRWRR